TSSSKQTTTSNLPNQKKPRNCGGTLSLFFSFCIFFAFICCCVFAFIIEYFTDVVHFVLRFVFSSLDVYCIVTCNFVEACVFSIFLLKLRHFRTAVICRKRASRMEAAACRRINW